MNLRSVIRLIAGFPYAVDNDQDGQDDDDENRTPDSDSNRHHNTRLCNMLMQQTRHGLNL